MIFKEEAIFLMIFLKFYQDDWLAIADESDAYGYVIIKPNIKWQNQNVSHLKARKPGSAWVTVNSDDFCQTNTESNDSQLTKVIDTPEGQFTISFTPKKRKRQLLIAQPLNHLVTGICQ